MLKGKKIWATIQYGHQENAKFDADFEYIRKAKNCAKNLQKCDGNVEF